MIIGTKIIDEQEIISLLAKGMDISSYVEELVPRVIRTKEIVNNQKYYIALKIRQNKTLRYYQKSKYYEEILNGVTIVGSAQSITDFRDLLGAVQMDKLMCYVFDEELSRLNQ